jgi:hypothetical protein
MSASEDELEMVEYALKNAAEHLRRYRRLVLKILGDSPEEIRDTMKALEDLTPTQIRERLLQGRQRQPSRGLEKDGKVIAARTEEEIFAALKMPYIPPEEREVP